VPDNSAVALHAYRRLYMGAARLQWQVLKLHGCAHHCPAAAAVSQTAYKCSAVTCSAVAGYQSACERGCRAAVAGSQTASSNNKARCIPAELCKLSRVKTSTISHLGWYLLFVQGVSTRRFFQTRTRTGIDYLYTRLWLEAVQLWFLQ
jgi:hypothetical protein